VDRLIIIGLDGLTYASWLFLVSAGLSFTFGVVRILNVAHGNLYALGAYLGAYVVVTQLGAGAARVLSYLALLAAALVVGATAGPLIERLFLRRVYGREEEVQLLLTFSILLILEDVIKLVWGVSPIFADKPYVWLGQVRLGGVFYAWYPFLLTAIALVTGALLWALVTRTRFGKILVSVIEHREMSAALGVDVPRLYTIAFSLGTALAALGGAFSAPMFSLVPGIGAEVIVISFAVVAIGGLGSIGGAALGSLLVGLTRSAAVHFVPELDLFAVYLIMTAVLVFRPEGLFGHVEVRRI
jgi:branched-chain amino acid transport system permease protein